MTNKNQGANDRSEVCHACGGQLIEKRVEKLLRSGVHTAVTKALAEVCQRCGEQIFSSTTARRFEEIRCKLANQETSDFVPLGQSFQVATTDEQAAS